MINKSIEKNFKKFIEQITPISDNEFLESMVYFKECTLNKGDYFVEQGKVCKQIAFINTGLLRTYHINEKGEDTTSSFCVENNFTASYQSLILQSPSKLSIQALEKTELLVIDYVDLQKLLYSKSLTWQHIGRIVVEKEYIIREEYTSVLNKETPKEKYLRLMKEQAFIIQKIPVQYIASYIGVTRRTLSRIRKETAHLV